MVPNRATLRRTRNRESAQPASSGPRRDDNHPVTDTSESFQGEPGSEPGTTFFTSGGPYLVTAYPWWALRSVPLNASVFLRDLQEIVDPVVAMAGAADRWLAGVWFERGFVVPSYGTGEIIRAAARDARLLKRFHAVRGRGDFLADGVGRIGLAELLERRDDGSEQIGNLGQPVLLGLAVMATAAARTLNGLWLDRRLEGAQHRFLGEDDQRDARDARRQMTEDIRAELQRLEASYDERPDASRIP